jgi:hypothetical protein
MTSYWPIFFRVEAHRISVRLPAGVAIDWKHIDSRIAVEADH